MRLIVSALIATVAASGLAACGSHHPASPQHTAATTAPSASRASADCSKLSAAAFPPAAYDQLVTSETSRIADGGDASAAQARQAKAAVASEIRSSCPQFTYLLPGR